ncbi:GreA/GreB family elongation factor [Lysobacter sp. ISL-50]|uniref:GreA/GreB family elongation factor n=1 Tax=unclassified Lysobacter TaxID=2635362 RepID=UPI001BE8DE4C|nr:GreA/GreB family elongation factor [Lysobacter sp. ISL-42]MBT2750487.1 GreA/GreB family elongation factor [Lysobacter sp. ISL-50]MBT2776333.1 GreA/GreB family elongation factor [Lysobacter sp. ISL-54]MBT2780828.1 GreA/GreB family elongation factor [Lysobacter sp. ISL-52]
MSRAFVKEGDGDENAGDLPELPISEHPNYVTPRGMALLRSRLDDAVRRVGALDADARLERAHIEREMRWLQARILGAITIAPERQPADRVAFGARVELVDDDGREYRYRVVGEDEADPEHGLISWVSPLARALHGARVGDSALWKRPAGDLSVEVLAIEYG